MERSTKGSETYNESNRLPHAVRELKPIFNRLSNETLLKRCLAGHTQNQNESLNGVLWSNCSKNKFCGVTKLKLAVCQSILSFNIDAVTKYIILLSSGIQLDGNSLYQFCKEDNVRIKQKYHCNIIWIDVREGNKTKCEPKVAYKAGSFGLPKNPEILSIDKKRKSKSEQVDLLISHETKNYIPSNPVESTFVDDCMIPQHNKDF